MSDTYWVNRFAPSRLRDARERCGWSKSALDRRIGKHAGTTRRYEKGSHTPRFETLCDLTQALEIDVLELLDDDREDLPVFRVRARMDQQTVASAIGVSRSMYQKIEAKQRSITRHKLALLARVLDTDEASIAPHVLVSEPGAPPPASQQP